MIIDAVSGRKQVLAHASLMPDVAILDAAVTEGVPPNVTAMTGIDALTHAIEAYSALNATPFTDSTAIGAIAMIGKSLPKAVGYGHDLAARENMLLASCMAGMAFSSAGLGLCHAMAHQPGRRCIFRTAVPTPCCCQQSWALTGWFAASASVK